jgi:pyridoxal phosphate enzyme (YggS family)
MAKHPFSVEIAGCLQRVHQQIIDAGKKYGRRQDVNLIAVSKGQPIAAIEAAYQAGQRAFGENYVQEALPKIKALTGKRIEWHFIGRIQTNKTKAIATYFDWVHSVCDATQATRLNNHRSAHLKPLQVCIQVNVSGELTKDGVSIESVTDLARTVASLPRLELRGLMTIAPEDSDFSQQRQLFAKLRQIVGQLTQDGLHCDVLSMGMSADFGAAIAEGATHLRVGTAIFGPRV